MLFGIGLIIWAMEDTERRLAALHARTVGRHAALEAEGDGSTR